MENFIVSARKYRPSTFDMVVGQGSIATTLKNAIKNNQLAHAYLFCGPRGVGKTTCARIFAKTINCFQITSETEACNQCESCKAFSESRSYNIHELDAASNNSVEDIRTLIDQVRIPPQIGKYSIYIIDEVHMLSASAFNAFLKTLEEPPRHAIFILATTEKHKIIPTILSRCQIFDFNRIKVDHIVNYLKYVAQQESVQIEEEGLSVISQKADGAMRDALSIFDQIVSFSGNNITFQNVIENLNVLDYDYYFRMVDAFLEGKVTETLLLYNTIIEKGFDGHHFINGLSCHLRDILVGKDPVTLQLLEVGESIRKKYLAQAGKCPQDFLYEALKILSNCDINYKASQNKRLLIEITLIQLSQIIELKKKENQLTSKTPELQKIQLSEKSAEVAVRSTPANSEKSSQTSAIPNKPSISAENPDTSVRSRNKVLSIKEAMQERVNENEATYNATTSSESLVQEEAFSEKDVEIKLKEFVKIKQFGENMRCALTAHPPNLKEDYQVVIPIDNSIQEDDIKKNKSEIVSFLKQELKNMHIKIYTEIIQNAPGEKIYTDSDKFNFLNQKNPALETLKKKFSLDFE